MNLGELRAQAAAALGSLSEDWTVHPAPVDALEPPAFVLVWGDPWLVPSTPCISYAQLEIVCVAARLEPEANYPTLEAMVAAATVALRGARLAPFQTARPAPFEVAQITYLAARILIRQPVDLGG